MKKGRYEEGVGGSWYWGVRSMGRFQETHTVGLSELRVEKMVEESNPALSSPRLMTGFG